VKPAYVGICGTGELVQVILTYVRGGGAEKREGGLGFFRF
jgi:hypothetical protein